MKIDLTAQIFDDPHLPAGPVKGFTASAVPVELVGIPATLGCGAVVGVSVTLTTPDGMPVTAPAEKVGSEWHVLFAASNFTSYGTTRHGFKTDAAIKRDDGTTFQTTLAVGNLQIDAGTPSAEPGDPSKGYVAKGDDIYLKSQIVEGVQHFVKQAMEYDAEIGWGATWSGDYILVDGEYVAYQASTEE